MSAQIAELLIGLYFVGASLPGLLDSGVSRATVLQFAFGLVLCLLAFMNIGLIGLVQPQASTVNSTPVATVAPAATR